MERQQTVKLTKANSTSHNNLQAKLAPQKPTPLSHPILQLQRKIGNQAVTRLLSSGGIQGKLSISHPADPYEREADHVADAVMRMAEPEAVEEKAPQVQANPLATQITPLVHRMPAQSVEEEEEKIVALKPLIQRVPVAVREDDEEEKVAPKLEPGAELQEEEYAPESREGRQLLAHELTHVVQQNGSQVQRAQPRATGQAPQVATSVEPDVERIESRRQTGKGNDNFFVLTRASAPTFFRSAQGAITQPTIQRQPVCPGTRDSGEVTKSQSPAGVLAVDTHFDAAKESLSVQDFGIDQDSVPPTMTQSDDWRRMMSMILGDPTTQVAVLGYSDCIGTEQNNRGLRNRRADAVIKAMPAEAQAKVSPIFKGWWGSLTYLFPNDTAQNRARNRMVLVALKRSLIDSCDGLPKATNIDQYIFLVSCLEKRLGLTNAADAPKTLSVLRQLYFGNAAWSTPRNRSKIWDDIITSRPWAPGNDPTPKLGANLLSALQASKEIKFDSSASSTSIEISHLLTGLDAMMNPQNPAILLTQAFGGIYLQTNVLNHALATWAGDVASAATNYTICVDFLKFSASYDDFFKDLASDADLEGDIDAYAAWAALNYSVPNAPALQLNLPISEVLMQYYRLKNTLGGQARAQRFEVFANFYGAKVQGRKMQDRLAFKQNIYPSVSEIAFLSFAKQIREVLQGNAASIGNCAGGKPPVQTGQPAPVDLGTLLASVATASAEMTERFTVWLERRL